MSGTVRLVRALGPVLFVGGVAALILAFLENEATLSLFVIFPVITATGAWAFLGILLMIAGVFVFFFIGPPPMAAEPLASPPGSTSPPSAASVAAGGRRWGGVVFLGPIPVVFGSDQKVTQWMLILGVVLFVALLVLTIIALRGI
jgi:uncharacterized protein (TIGR00304 family)